MSDAALRRSILTEKLARRGQHIAREYSVDLFELMRVSDVMDRNVTLLSGSTALRDYAARLATGDPSVCSHQGTLLGNDEGELMGIITRGDVVRALSRTDHESLSVLTAGTAKPIVAFPDETLYDAIARLLHYNIGRLPVVERDASSKVVGYLGRADILAARGRHHHEEEVRERGGMAARRGTAQAAAL